MATDKQGGMCMMAGIPRSGMIAVCSVALFGSASAQISTKYRTVDAAPGKLTPLGLPYVNVPKDCSSVPPPEISVVKPPTHGEVAVQVGALKAGTVKRCPSLAAKSQVVNFQAAKNYKGSDEVGYEVKFANGKVDRHVVRINVVIAPSHHSGKAAREKDVIP